MNITDVDDKTIRGAQAKGVGLDEYTKPFIEAFGRDRDTLAILPADHYPQGDGPHPGDGRPSSRPSSKRASPTRRTGRSISPSTSSPPTGACPGSISRTSGRGAASDADEYEKESVHDFALWKAPKEGEPVLGDRDRPGPARLAHRVLGHERQVSREDVRHPLRRRRQHLPAPRERDRPIRGGQRRQVRRLLAPLPPPRRRRREDVEIEGQFLYPGGHPGQGLRAVRRPLSPPLDPLPEDAQLHLRGPGPGPDGAPEDRQLPRRAQGRHGDGRRQPAPSSRSSRPPGPVSSPGSRTTSTSPRPWPRCSP